MRTTGTAAVLFCLFLALGGCDGDGPGTGPLGDVLPSADATPDAADPDAAAPDDAAPAGDASAACPASLGDLAEEPCPAAMEGESCTETMDWCGEPFAVSGCECTDGTWHCWSAGAPSPCHTCCQAAHGATWFCTQDGRCVEASGCLAEECCVPGAQGDEWCRATFGDCSRCEPATDTGTCTPQTCP